jgi:phage tail-like protein
VSDKPTKQQLERLGPLQVFAFDVAFTDESLTGSSGSDVKLCAGSFSEVTGLEATMEPKVIKEGGRNFGVVQRVGPVTFATVVFKRGISTTTDLWKWFELIAGGATAKRLTATITMRATYGEPGESDPHKALYRWRLHRALPTKFKHADFNAQSTAVGIEELHVAHEGFELVMP